MTQKQFSILSPSQQTELVTKRGIFLCERVTRNWMVYLFQMEGFYVELYYDWEKEQVAMTHTFQSTNLLDPYLETIDLSGLLD